MHKQVCPGYFGDIDAELLLQNITNLNPNCNTIDQVREFVRGFTVSAEYEFTWNGDPNTTLPEGKGGRFVRLILEPKE